jgi:ribonuclease HI
MQQEKPRPDGAQRRITIAFDGACLGNPGSGGYGAILIHEPTGREKIVRGGDPATTNNRMELTAAIEALNALRPGASVTMIGDSQYVLKGMTEWLPGWKARGWRTAQRKPVLNVELWQEPRGSPLSRSGGQSSFARWLARRSLRQPAS